MQTHHWSRRLNNMRKPCNHAKASSWREDQHKPILHCVNGCGATAKVDWAKGGKIVVQKKNR